MKKDLEKLIAKIASKYTIRIQSVNCSSHLKIAVGKTGRWWTEGFNPAEESLIDILESAEMHFEKRNPELIRNRSLNGRT